MESTLGDVVSVMDSLAPKSLAEDWDNVGLQVGGLDWPVRKIWVALDAAEGLVSEACSQGVDLLITHHPLIFQPIRSLDLNSGAGKIIRAAIENKLAIFSAHTNLDSAAGGVNDVLADRLGLESTEVLRPVTQAADGLRKLVVFVPLGHEDSILNVLFDAGGGETEKYTHVSFRSKGVGSFRPGPKAKPFEGRVGVTSLADEYRIEALVAAGRLTDVIQRLKQAHPYEEMAFDVYTTAEVETTAGLGRIGDLAQEVPVAGLARQLKKELGLDWVKVAGDSQMAVKRVAVCCGSGRGLLGSFLASDAQAYVSGDLGYHDGRTVEEAGRALIDVGHFASEQLIVGKVAEKLKRILSERGYAIDVTACDQEKDCFYYV